MLRSFLWYSTLAVTTVFFILVGVGSFVVYQVFLGDTSNLEKSTIMTRIKEETILYYLDEETTIGSIFESKHRRYIPISEIPPHMINAIVAAEDKEFFSHFGINPFAIAKAISEGIANGGRFRRGGSTITQQTVKNIVDDWDATFSRKFREMIKALQLERLYSKQQILEFYLNQFHVAGNGNGVEIAARYYFNKDIREINLVEAAFIAGSVKGPGKYNPFIKFNKDDQEKAKLFAQERKNYVLDRMVEQQWITPEEHKEARNTPIQFNRGEFRTGEVTLLDLVKTELEKEEILNAIGLKNPEDINTAGLHVYTTLDAELQTAAQLDMRKNLSRLETILSGFKAEKPENFRAKRALEDNEFVYGKVTKIEGNSPTTYKIHLSLGVPTGTISSSSLIRYAKLLDLVDGKGYQYHLSQIMGAIKLGDVLYTQVLQYDKQTHEAVLELQKRPEISGGMVVLDKGEVRAVISGFDTLGFNRAIYAKRQPGSAFKALVFFAGLQLGWSVLESLDNGRQIFPYQGRYYYPKPDHISPYDTTSMLWSGVMSENLASVSLGSKLIEKINLDQFNVLLKILGLTPKDGELPRDYHYRVARKTGVSLDNEGIKEYQLENAKNEIEADLIFSGSEELAKHIKRMWWGYGYPQELSHIRRMTPTSATIKELKTRDQLVRNNFLRYKKLNEAMLKDWKILETRVHADGPDEALKNASIAGTLHRFRVLISSGSRPELGYSAPLEGEESSTLEDSASAGRPLNVLDVQAIWGKDQFFAAGQSADISAGDVKLSGILPSKILQKMDTIVENQYDAVLRNEDPYRTFHYFQHHDFRIAIGLEYLVALGKECGVFSPLDPVLSFPLGTSVVTASEVAKIFQTFIDGKTYKFFEKGPENQISFIRKIADRAGNILYEVKSKEHQLVKPEIAYEMREILRKTVTHGTGRRARGELFIDLGEDTKPLDAPIDENAAPSGTRIRIPAFGKTGTTNDYTTSYFAGFLPYPTQKGKPLDPSNSYVIAAYVGYDDNKEMHRGRQRIYGGVGALPMWVNFSKNIIEKKKYKDSLDALDLNVLAHREWPTSIPKRNIPLLVDLPKGLILREGAPEDVETWTTTNLEFTGETFENPYALDSSISSVVYVPQEIHHAKEKTAVLFSPFSKH